MLNSEGHRHPLTVLSLILIAVPWLAPPAEAQTKLLRFPDISGDRVAFTYSGDIWTAPATGGQAVRITAHPGLELFPKFSPDGRWIAFTGQYDGDEQVYVVPATGGVPKQLTYYPASGPLAERWGYDNQVYGWTPDGSAVLFRSMRSGFDLSDTQLFTVSVDGGLPAALPMPESGAGALSPDGGRVVYSPLFRDFRSWKRYEGGWAQELYIFDLASYGLTRVTDHPRADRDPMWLGGTIYFNSDRDGRFNLYAYDVASGSTRQVTTEATWDVRWPSDDGSGRIVYENDGELEVLDVASGGVTRLAITVPDDGLGMRPSRVSAADLIEDYELSPGGERALFVARGDIFTAPIEYGPTRNLTNTSGAHEKGARWSPDGRWISYLSDATGEEEVYLIAQDGSAEATQLTEGGVAFRYTPVWSPDGKRLAFGDKDGKLYALDIASRRLTEVADAARGQIRDYTWSPHGGHLAFSMSDPNGFGAIYVWSVADGRTRRVTGELFNEWSPEWGTDGDYLYYLSDREYAPQISGIEWNFATDRTAGIYALALRRDVAHPFPPRSDEVKIGEEDDEEDDEDEEAEADSSFIAIDFEGLADRVARVPVEFDNYGGLSAIDDNLIFVRRGSSYYGRSSAIDPAIMIFSLEDREAKTLVEDAGNYALSSDGKKILVRQDEAYKLYDAVAEAKDPKTVSTSDLMVDRVPAAEWRQIFHEVWRRFRDFFYVENMHGYDWEALREQYEPWLAHVAHRSDLNYVISEMLAELSVGHAYIAGGDWQTPGRPQVALPGAVIELDPAAGRYQIAKIYAGDNSEPKYRSPLRELGVDAREGDYILAIDGEELEAADNPYERLRGRAGSPVALTLNSEPRTRGARTVTFDPITSEDGLIYLDWVEGNRRRVNEATDGRVGYLHLPDMGSNGIYEFIKWYYPQIRKEGLVIDVRGNGGGNVSAMIIERLSRDILGTRFSRNSDTPGTYPSSVFYGHMVTLIDEDAASDGDIFPYRFREAGLGPLIGKRTWGGVVGITNHGQLIDGGTVNVPEFGTNALDGSWIIEGYGVEPDIEVENDPASVIAGHDPQLERGIAEVMRAIDADPKRLPVRPADPVKTP